VNEGLDNFIQFNSPDGGFLQSEYWRKFQESVGRKTYNISANDENGEPIAWANIIEHTLPIAGKYFYVPRGPVVSDQRSLISDQFFGNLLNLAKKNNAGWIRIEPPSDEELELIKKNNVGADLVSVRDGQAQGLSLRIKKSSVDMQPREILILDISKSEEEILAGMKQKTRYNIRLAEKRGVKIHGTWNMEHGIKTKYVEDFLRLIKITAERDKIAVHPEGYYQKMFEVIPSDVLKLYAAEYQGKIIAANLVVFFGKTATYLHGASDDEHRNVMAPYLLQWRQIQDAKAAGCERYDFGGVKTEKISNFKFQISNSWQGITKFKTGFAPKTRPILFPGCYDIVLNPVKYNSYIILQKIKRVFR
jgi:lipid II:glycine glycyltransferase (peptidoglycan interpeptide bridge formation enzyme)